MNTKLTAAALSLTVVSSLTAATLVEYDFTSVSLTPSLVSSGLSASNVNFTGSSASHNTGVIVGMWANSITVDRGAGATSPTSAFTSDSYLQFDFGVDPGVTVNLSSLEFEAASLWSPDPSGSYWEVRSSADGYSSILGNGSQLSSALTWTTYSVDLSAPDFQSLTSGLNFRLYLSDSVGNPSQAFDSLTLNGSQIPEPSSALLLSLSLILMRRARS